MSLCLQCQHSDFTLGCLDPPDLLQSTWEAYSLSYLLCYIALYFYIILNFVWAVGHCPFVAFACLIYLDLVTLSFDLWPWSTIASCTYTEETVYQCLTSSCEVLLWSVIAQTTSRTGKWWTKEQSWKNNILPAVLFGPSFSSPAFSTAHCECAAVGIIQWLWNDDGVVVLMMVMPSRLYFWQPDCSGYVRLTIFSHTFPVAGAHITRYHLCLIADCI